MSVQKTVDCAGTKIVSIQRLCRYKDCVGATCGGTTVPAWRYKDSVGTKIVSVRRLCGYKNMTVQLQRLYRYTDCAGTKIVLVQRLCLYKDCVDTKNVAVQHVAVQR